jgi:3-dehydroquinate synthase
MVMAARLSQQVSGLMPDSVDRLIELLAKLGLPTEFDQHSLEVMTVASMIDAMGLDKKVVDGRLRFIVASELGQVALRDDIDSAIVRDVLNQWF